MKSSKNNKDYKIYFRPRSNDCTHGHQPNVRLNHHPCITGSDKASLVVELVTLDRQKVIVLR
jgi:hypothetical protein